MTSGLGGAIRTRLFPNINHPDYRPTGSRSGFGWPNLIAWWESSLLSFREAAVPFALVIPWSGTADVSVSGSSFRVREGTYLAVPPGSSLHVNAVEPEPGRSVARLSAAFFNPVFVRTVWESDEATFHPLARLYPSDELSGLLAASVEEYLAAPNDLSVDDEEIEDLFVELVRMLAERHDADRERWRRLVARDEEEGKRLLAQLNRARDLAETEFASPLTVDHLARAAAISKYHFIRLFERAFGLTPHRYLLRMRLEHARRRLSAGMIPISTVRAECGFASLGSFSWAFKRAFGVSPSQFAISEKPGHPPEE